MPNANTLFDTVMTKKYFKIALMTVTLLTTVLAGAAQHKSIDQKVDSVLKLMTLDEKKLSFYNQQLQWVTEPGDFDLMIGASSKDIRLKDSFELVK